MAQISVSFIECKQLFQDKLWCKHGQSKCFSCFSRHHRTSVCPVRNTDTPKWFVPKIDKDLLTRFFKTFDPLEQYSMVISIPETLNFIGLKKVQVKPKILINRCAKFSNKDTVVVVDGEVRIRSISYDNYDNIFFHSNSNGYWKFIEAVSKKQLFVKAQKAVLENAILSLEFLSLLLSPITKVLHCYKLTLTSNITFAEILQKLPNLEDLLILDTNVKIGNKWVEDLKNHGKNIIKLNIEIKNFNFYTEELAKIIKTKNAKIGIAESTGNEIELYHFADKYSPGDFSGDAFSSVINSGLPKYFTRPTTKDPDSGCFLCLLRVDRMAYFLEPL